MACYGFTFEQRDVVAIFVSDVKCEPPPSASLFVHTQTNGRMHVNILPEVGHGPVKSAGDPHPGFFDSERKRLDVDFRIFLDLKKEKL